MSDPSSDHEDLMALWQGQSQETDPMILDHIRAISRRLDRNEQRGTLIAVAATAFTAFSVGLVWQTTHDSMIRASFVLFALGMAGFLAMYFHTMRLTRDPTEPGGVFLRRRLERDIRLTLGRGNLPMLLPLAPALVCMVVVVATHKPPATAPHLTGLQLALNFLPIVALAALWLGFMFFYVPSYGRRLRRDLDDLNAAMK